MSTTISPVTVVCSSALVTTVTVTVAFPCVQLATALCQHDVALPPSLILRSTVRGVVGLGTVPQQKPQSQIPYQACVSYAMGPPQVIFYF